MVQTSKKYSACEEAVLVADQLFKVYPGSSEPALKGLDLTVCQGEVFGLLGPNGAGKTTAISIMCSLLKPSRGSVTLCGVDVLKHPRQARKMIGLVPQDIALYQNLTLVENLNYFGKLYGLKGGRLADAVEESLALVGLEDSACRSVGTFSGGMKRRANLAAGILHRPSLLFLDEPTVGIDAQSRNLILENLARLKKEGMTMVYTTHYMEEAQQLCDRIAIMDDGRILREGAPGQLVGYGREYGNLEELFLGLTGRYLRD